MKKKGFTLIELLAVIVILAIIALIATPLVLKYIETSRIESFKVSIENIKDSAIKYVASQQLEDKLTYPVIVDVQDLDFKGKEDYTGKIIVQKDGIIEEYITKEDYRTSNGSFVNGNITPYLKVKEGKTAVIDDNNNYVYSFYMTFVANGYRANNLTEDVLNSIFDVENGSMEYITTGNAGAPYTTGAKIVVKDKDGNIFKEYEIVIFGDINGDGFINGSDTVILMDQIDETVILSKIQFFTADLNRDNKVNEFDKEIIMDHITGPKKYNQFTNKLEDR